MMTDPNPVVTTPDAAPIRRIGPIKRCPTHHTALDEGPIKYRCPQGHAVYAADLSNDYPTSGRAAA
jgi:hypothetical protein